MICNIVRGRRYWWGREGIGHQESPQAQFEASVGIGVEDKGQRLMINILCDIMPYY